MDVPKTAHDTVKAHHPEDLVKAVQHQPEAMGVAKELLQRHHNMKKIESSDIIARFPRYISYAPDRSTDLEALSRMASEFEARATGLLDELPPSVALGEVGVRYLARPTAGW